MNIAIISLQPMRLGVFPMDNMNQFLDDKDEAKEVIND